ncbi:hypothetical protein KAM576c_28950 [Enterobacter asburiae]|nr:hypothetical protein KAM576c_28950 [Enterobacter asburiae]
MVGRATFAIAPSRTAIEIPIMMVAIAPYRWGKGRPSERVFSIRIKKAQREIILRVTILALLQPRYVADL